MPVKIVSQINGQLYIEKWKRVQYSKTGKPGTRVKQ